MLFKYFIKVGRLIASFHLLVLSIVFVNLCFQLWKYIVKVFLATVLLFIASRDQLEDFFSFWTGNSIFMVLFYFIIMFRLIIKMSSQYFGFIVCKWYNDWFILCFWLVITFVCDCYYSINVKESYFNDCCFRIYSLWM